MSEVDNPAPQLNIRRAAGIRQLDEKKDNWYLHGGRAGALSSTMTVAARTVISPIEKVKLLIQTQDANPKIISGEVPRYTGIGDCAKRVVAEQGLTGFWNWRYVLHPPAWAPQACLFGVYESTKSLYWTEKPESWSGELKLDFILGAGAGVVECIARCVVAPSSRRCATLFAGRVLYSGLHLGVYDTMLRYNPYQDHAALGTLSALVCAPTAVFCGGVAAAPFGKVSNRLAYARKHVDPDTGARDCFAKLLREEGVLRLFRPQGLHIGRAFVMFVVLDRKSSTIDK
eukprot:COSAG01_NODE_2340_length_7871_cov_32.734431_3_plen_286_part_00